MPFLHPPETSARTEIGKCLRVMRQSRGISTAEMAERCECTVSSIRMMEQGQRFPSITRMIKLAEAMDLTCRYVFEVAGIAADGGWAAREPHC